MIAGKTAQPTVISPALSIHPNDITMQTVDVTFSPENASAPTTYTTPVNDFYSVVSEALNHSWSQGVSYGTDRPTSGDISIARKNAREVTITAFSTQVDIDVDDLYALDNFFNDIITTRTAMRGAVGDSFIEALRVGAKNESYIQFSYMGSTNSRYTGGEPISCDGVFLVVKESVLGLVGYRLANITNIFH